MREKVGQRSAIGGVIGLLVFASAMTLRTFFPADASAGLPDAAFDFFTLSISVFVESLPFIFLGVLLSVLVQIWLPARLFDRAR